MHEVAAFAIESAQNAGAQQVAASAYRTRDVEVQWRDGRLEKVTEATSRGVSLELYVDGRYASVSTSDLRPDALRDFVAESVAMARALAEDRFRVLPDPALYVGQAAVDLHLEDPDYTSLSAALRLQWAAAIEAAAHTAPGHEKILSVTAGVSDNRSESWRIHSNGFSGYKCGTSYWLAAEVSALDPDGRRPEESDYASCRFYSELPDPAAIGLAAAQRTLRRVGAHKPRSQAQAMIVDHRSSGQLLSYLLGPLSGAALQQKRSFLDGLRGKSLGSALLDVRDEPLLASGFGSRLFDAEGIAAKPMQLFNKGVLENYYIDTYYGRKLAEPATTGRMSNLAWTLGKHTQAQLLKQVGDGILVTGFLGGNANATTGDYSLGVQGFAVRNGEIAEPVAEVNIAGNQRDLWQQLVAVGNDPYAYSPMQTPTLVFEQVQFAGSE